jgi:hypothetical protein
MDQKMPNLEIGEETLSKRRQVQRRGPVREGISTVKWELNDDHFETLSPCAGTVSQ